jgi:hypothetical protein
MGLILAILLMGQGFSSTSLGEGLPGFTGYSTPGELSWLSMTCSKLDGLKKIRCQFTQVRINEPEAKSVEDEIKKTFDQMELEKEKPSDLRKTFCGETQAKLKSHIKASSKMRKEYILPLNSLNESIDTLCTCLPKKNISPKVGKACLLEFMRSTLEKKTKTCKITTNYFTKRF